MKKIKYLMTFVFLSLLLVSGCKDYVTNIDPLIDAVEDSRLNQPSQVDFLITGVKAQFSFTIDNLLVIADGLSDQFIFTFDVPNATYPTFEDIDKGDIQKDNNSVDGPFNNLGELRFFADNLVERVGQISGLSDTKKEEALYTGYLFGGLARYYYATYFGLNPTEGGGVIDAGPFIPSQKMYDLAAEKLTEALKHTNDAYQKRVVNSLLARLYLYKGDYAKADSYAENGMVSGDNPFQALYTIQSDNYYWEQAGEPRSQFVCDFRFHDYVVNDPAEAARIPLSPITGNSGKVYYFQEKYPTADSPINHMTWQENNLMLAELSLRGANSKDALALVNEVRQSHGLSDLSSIDLDGIYVERDKELFCTGNRLPDERRFNKFHLPSGSWQYFPITQNERNANPNLK